MDRRPTIALAGKSGLEALLTVRDKSSERGGGSNFNAASKAEPKDDLPTAWSQMPQPRFQWESSG